MRALNKGSKLALNSENLADMPRSGEGIAAALNALDVEGKLDVEEEAQDLFDTSPLLAAQPTLAPVRARGRKPGSLNRTTDEWRNYWLRHYRSPLLWLGDLITADPFALHQAIRAADGNEEGARRVSLLDVINLQRGAAEALAPYLHRKQPIAIDGGEDKQLPVIQQLIVGADAVARIFPQRTENADDLAYTPVEVADAKSHDDDEGGVSG